MGGTTAACVDISATKACADSAAGCAYSGTDPGSRIGATTAADSVAEPRDGRSGVTQRSREPGSSPAGVGAVVGAGAGAVAPVAVVVVMP